MRANAARRRTLRHWRFTVSHFASVLPRRSLNAAELARWDDISRRMFVPFHERYISQFEGYEKLAELDWQRYRLRYGNIQRLDLILEAENDSTNRYKLAKQADVLMLFYLFSADELAELFRGLDYPFEGDMIGCSRVRTAHARPDTLRRRCRAM